MSDYRKELFKGGLSGAGISSLSQLSTIFLKLFVSRVFGPAGIGLYEIVLSLIRISSDLIQGGLSQMMVKYLSQLEKRIKERQLVFDGFIALCGVSIIAMILLILGKELISSKILNSHSARLYEVIVVSIPLWALSQYIAYCLRGIKRTGLSVAMQSGFFPLAMLLLVLTFLGENLNTLFFTIPVVLLGINALGLYYLVKNLIKGSLTLRRDIKVYTNLIFDSTPMWLISVARIFSLRIDKIILAIYMDAVLVGIYSVGFLVSSLIQIIPSFITPISQPLLANKIKNRDSSIGDLYQDLVMFSVILMTPVYFMMAINGDLIISFFGEEFTEAYAVMIVLGAGNFINGLVGPTGDIMIMGGKEKILAILQYISVLLTVIFFIILIPRFGILGAAVARSASWAIIEIIKLYFVAKYFKIKSFKKYQLQKSLLVGVCFFIAGFFLMKLKGEWIRAVASFFTFLFIYLSLYRSEINHLFQMIRKRLR